MSMFEARLVGGGFGWGFGGLHTGSGGPAHWLHTDDGLQWTGLSGGLNGFKGLDF